MKLRCANCSAELALERDEAFFVCPFCSSSLYLDQARTFKSFLLPPAHSETSARDLLAREIARREIPPAAVTRCDRVLLPFWGVRGQNLQETLPAFSPVSEALQGYRLPAAGAVFYRDDVVVGGGVVTARPEHEGEYDTVRTLERPAHAGRRAAWNPPSSP